MIDGWGISYEIALMWMPLDFTDDQSTLVQVIVWCRQATSHSHSQCWPRSMSPYGVTRPEWVKWQHVFLPGESPTSAMLDYRWLWARLCFFSANASLPEPLLAYCQLDSWEHISVNFESDLYKLHSRKCIWICRLQKWLPFFPGGDGSIFREVCWYQIRPNHMTLYVHNLVPCENFDT